MVNFYYVISVIKTKWSSSTCVVHLKSGAVNTISYKLYKLQIAFSYSETIIADINWLQERSLYYNTSIGTCSTCRIMITSLNKLSHCQTLKQKLRPKTIGKLWDQKNFKAEKLKVWLIQKTHCKTQTHDPYFIYEVHPAPTG